MAERLVRDLAIEEDPQIEIQSTLSHNNQSYVQWYSLSDEDRNKNKVKLTVTYDMFWKKRSSGRRYDSSIGHVFFIGGIPKEFIGMVFYSKACQKCDAADNRGEEVEEHDSTKNV